MSLPVDIIAFCIVASILRVRTNWSNGANNFPNDTRTLMYGLEGENVRERFGVGV